jgi:hypothetical protein
LANLVAHEVLGDAAGALAWVAYFAELKNHPDPALKLLP